MKSDAKIALVTLALIVLVIVAYVVFVPAKPVPPAASAPTATATPKLDTADATVVSATEPVPAVTAGTAPNGTLPTHTLQSVAATTAPAVPAVADVASALAPATQPASLSVIAAPASGATPTGTPDPTAPSATSPPTYAPPAPAAPAGSVDWEGVLRGARSVDNARVASSTTPAGSGTTSLTPSAPTSTGPQVSLGTPPAGQPLVGSAVTTPAASGLTGGTYTIGRGDTLSTVAQKAYGSAALWPHIARANPEVNPNRLKLGTVLRIPDVATVKGATASLPAEPNTTSGSSLVVDPAREYQIVSGDSLEKISRKLYGDASKVNAIYDLNRDLIGADPARLRVRTILKLPSAPTVTATPAR